MFLKHLFEQEIWWRTSNFIWKKTEWNSELQRNGTQMCVCVCVCRCCCAVSLAYACDVCTCVCVCENMHTLMLVFVCSAALNPAAGNWNWSSCQDLTPSLIQPPSTLMCSPWPPPPPAPVIKPYPAKDCLSTHTLKLLPCSLPWRRAERRLAGPSPVSCKPERVFTVSRRIVQYNCH